MVTRPGFFRLQSTGATLASTQAVMTFFSASLGWGLRFGGVVPNLAFLQSRLFIAVGVEGHAGAWLHATVAARAVFGEERLDVVELGARLAGLVIFLRLIRADAAPAERERAQPEDQRQQRTTRPHRSNSGVELAKT